MGDLSKGWRTYRARQRREYGLILRDAKKNTPLVPNSPQALKCS